MATRILMNNFVFCSQVKFIFGTLGKRKSINYFVAMEISLPCYSLGDVLIWYICSLGQQKSNIRKFPLGAGYIVQNLSLSIVVYISLESSNFPPDIALHALHCEMLVILSDSARSSMDVFSTRFCLLHALHYQYGGGGGGNLPVF